MTKREKEKNDSYVQVYEIQKKNVHLKAGIQMTLQCAVYRQL